MFIVNFSSQISCYCIDYIITEIEKNEKSQRRADSLGESRPPSGKRGCRKKTFGGIFSRLWKSGAPEENLQRDSSRL
jgi:hypothetical protein